MRKKIIYIALFLFVCLVPGIVHAEDKIHFIKSNSYGADAIVIESNGHYGLIDAMNPGYKLPEDTFDSTLVDLDNGTRVYDYLKGIGCTKLDFFIMTHNHSDHIGGVRELQELVTENTITMYKPDMTVADDYEEVSKNWFNHGFYEMAMNYFDSKESSLSAEEKELVRIDVSDTNFENRVYPNGFDNLITGITKGVSGEPDYETTLKDTIYFTFGNYTLNLYNLYNISYYTENLNSIAILVKHNDVKVALMGDLDSATGDTKSLETPGGLFNEGNYTNLIKYPVGTCEECITSGLENQIADIMGDVDIVKAGHHGAGLTSNSYYMLNTLLPEVYIIPQAYKAGTTSPHDDAVPAILFLKKYNETDSYYTNQADGAIVVEFGTGSNYSIKNYDASTNPVTISNISPISDISTSGWQWMYDISRANKKYVYVSNGDLLTGWNTLGSDVYHFDDYGIMDTGLFFDDLDGKLYYLNEDISSDYANYGKRVKGWVTLTTIENEVTTSEVFYFRESDNDISTGNEGEALIGLQTIEYNSSTEEYFFRTSDDLKGRYGSMLIGTATENACASNQTGENTVTIYCADQTGHIVSRDTFDLNEVVEIPVLDADEFEYTGNEIGPTFTYDPEKITVSGVQKATNVGTYIMTYTLVDSNAKWENGTTDPLEVEWSITKATYSKPVVNNYNGIYDGQPHSITATGDGTLEYSLDNTIWTETKPTSTNIGNTTVYVRVKEDSNHNRSAVETGSIKIGKLTLDKPTLNNMVFVYTGTAQGPTINNYNSNFTTKIGTENTDAVGIYTITISLNNTENISWSDGTITPVELQWQIMKAEVENPVVSSETVAYDGQPHTITATGTGTIEYSTDGENWSSTKPTRTVVGDTIVYVKIPEDEGHTASDIVMGTISITTRKLTKPTINITEFAYSGSAIQPNILNFDSDWMVKTGDLSATNASTNNYVITVSLNDINNTSWSDDTNADLTFNWKINKANVSAPSVSNYNGTYDGQPHTITTNATGAIKYSTDNSNWSSTIPTRTDVGTTSVYVKISGDDNHNESSVATGKITITKANLPAPSVTNYSGIYDGQPHTITVGDVTGGTIKYSTNNSTWTEIAPTRTAAGETIIYVKVFGDSNHNDSSVVTGKITIDEDTTYRINNYPVDETNKYIGKIMPNTELNTFKSNITLGIGYYVLVDTKTVNGKQLLYTGGKTKIMYNSTLIAQYTNIVMGDSNGDGEVDSADLLRTRQHMLGTNPLTGVYFIATDLEEDNSVDSADLLRLRQHLLGTRVIE